MLIRTEWPRVDVCLVRLRGELDMGTADAVLEHLQVQTAAGPDCLVLDLTDVSLIAAAGISLLITALRNEQGVRGRLHVVVPPGAPVWRTLHLTGVDTVLPIHRSLDEALLETGS